MFAAAWAAAIWYWRSADSAPTVVEMGLCLAIAPAAVAIAFWGARKLLASAPSAPVANATAQGAPPPTLSARGPQLAIIGAAIRSPHGLSPEELAMALDERKANADLDEELVDDAGFPITSARCDDAVDEALQDEIRAWLAEHMSPTPHFGDEHWRALIMATSVAGELASQAAWDLRGTHDAPMMTLVPVLPGHWNAAQRDAAGRWLKHTVSQFGLPENHVTLAPDIPNLQVAASINKIAETIAAGTQPAAALVIACESSIGEDTVAAWSESKMLFTPSQPQKLIPGEGAAGLLLTSIKQALTIEDALFVVMDQLASAPREASADDTRRADGSVLKQVVEGRIALGQVAAADLAMIVADTGHRSNRAQELMDTTSAALPHLDLTEDVISAGMASGSCGQVPFVTALALARHYALVRMAPVVCISNEDPYQRIAGIVHPPSTTIPQA